MAQLTLEEHFAKMKRQARTLAKENVPLRIAARTTHAFITNRIFHEGKNSADGSIGTYNATTELWVSDKDLRRSGTHRGKTGKPTKTSYYQSYRALKQQQGFNPNVVNLRLQNALQSDFANVPMSPNSNASPEPNTIRVNPNEYVIKLRKEVNVQKFDGLEKKYGAIFKHTKRERKLFYSVAQKELIKYLNR
jgi:hypothetical protein